MFIQLILLLFLAKLYIVAPPLGDDINLYYVPSGQHIATKTYNMFENWDEIYEIEPIEEWGHSDPTVYFIKNNKFITQAWLNGHPHDTYVFIDDNELILHMYERMSHINIKLDNHIIGIQYVNIHYYHRTKKIRSILYDLRKTPYDKLMKQRRNIPIIKCKYTFDECFEYERQAYPQEIISYIYGRLRIRYRH